ncbi:NAD(P)-binding domain-containing protein [Streptomyces sp. SKN60]|uniref:NADPH-dependent F420 reductase n=1 Tax=Streptomyces sp. SKN60 TaxID=2855506 RepID=UPI0022462339|nr:NAD(P)-binding domain-containing protein [Streptomyces sp. SKN60]MCX2182866.1 NAD(P)-binding domain-containing protein [Streptomyces sp. SKN60]
MKIAVLGTGEVGRRLGSKLVALGHEVTLGSRSADHAGATAWAAEHGAAHGTFAAAAHGAEVVVNATGGLVSLAALESAGADNLAGKVLIDVSNALDFSQGTPPKVLTPDGGSLAEQIQRAFPGARVVKTLNTMNNAIMVDPARVPGEHCVFVCGDDQAAKEVVIGLLRAFGWPEARILDLGDLSGARGAELLLPLWLRLLETLGTADFNFAVLKA